MAQVEWGRSALLAIRRETLAAGENETGGVLLGPDFPDRFIISEAHGPGPRHVASTLHYEVDHAHLIEQIVDGESRGLVYHGEWHRHPTWLKRPSDGDLRAFRHNMEKNPQLSCVLIVLTTVENGAVGLHSFVLDRTGGLHAATNGGYVNSPGR